MTSHYLICTIKEPFETLFQSLSNAFGSIYSRKIGQPQESRFGVILGEEYFFRVNSDVAVLILLKERCSNETEAEVISCAGGSGLLSASAGSHSAYVHKVKKFLKDSGFEIESVKEISFFSNHSEG